MSPHTDVELVARVQNGERELYVHLVERYQGVLFRYALGVVRDGDVAKDLVQDCFIRAYQSLSSCQNPAAFAGWLFRILRNRALDHLKEHRRRDLPLAEDAPYASERALPDQEMERTELSQRIERALSELPPEQRDAFLLKHVAGKDYEEMAELTGVGVSALKMRVKRAREALQVALARVGISPNRSDELVVRSSL